MVHLLKSYFRYKRLCILCTGMKVSVQWMRRPDKVTNSLGAAIEAVGSQQLWVWGPEFLPLAEAVCPLIF